MVKISVIMPVYNDEEYLSQALESILKQNIDDIEIVCVNDGSVDNSLNILNEYANKYDFIKVFTKENEGSGIARNYALTKASGEYIAYLDSDDEYLNEDALQLMYETAIEKNADMVSANLKGINLDGTLENNRNLKRFKSEGFITPEEYGIPYSFYKNIFKKSFLVKNNIIFPDLLRGQDPVFLAEILTLTDKIPTVPVDLYGFRYSAKSDLLKMNTYRKRYDYIKHFKDTFDILTASGFNTMKRNYEKKLKDFIKAFHNRYTKEVKDIVLEIFKDDEHILSIVEPMFINPKVSVIIPFNEEDISPNPVKYVSNQSLKEIEILCIDKKSDDNILNDLKLKDSRIRVLSCDVNDAIDNATGDYIYYFNINDELEKNTLKQAYRKITKDNSDLLIFKGDLFDENGKTPEIYFDYDIKSNNLTYADIGLDIFKKGYLLGCKLFKKDFIKSLDCPFDEIIIHFTSIFKSNNISYINKVLYHKYDLDKTNPEIFSTLDLLEEFLKDENHLKDFEKDFCEFKAKEILINLDENNFKKAQDSIKDLNMKFIEDDYYLKACYDILCSSDSFNDFYPDFERISFENKVKNYETFINQLKQNNDDLKKRNKKLNQLNQEILNSTSWKITKPLRNLKKAK